jgi:hypothetical protein
MSAVGRRRGAKKETGVGGEDGACGDAAEASSHPAAAVSGVGVFAGLIDY